MFAMFALGWIGGGDAKLAAAIALWLGWGVLLDYSLSAAIYGGALTIAILLGRRQALRCGCRATPGSPACTISKTGVPYGVALAAAGMMFYPHTEILARRGRPVALRRSLQNLLTSWIRLINRN